ncbi:MULTISPECIES: copper amine oxidase N-terminal domain-containing protein [unclassified Paenibacillus]|uniref:copper amine oxidase N-terminal domain-containing protein n=1 Tax=unclassified Paenibacillus TaxID=185978 RepID=UPI001C113C48|nr:MULTISPECIES: copper amine oxidase N-terminal domain-containing protein [unclassified Paenibacillus]MBU5445473.1 copper amine oxidase N-terminal domain-containing protein [Paenibacillus sp. MSJ-34]CAH0119708.1 hypothetical protein PAE9249_02214 [Paenibacillus sp. CECT 9249]
MRWYRPILVCMLFFATLIAVHPDRTFAAGERPVKVFVDTAEIAFQVQPLTIKGATLVQFRPLFEAMGLEVDWDQTNQVVTGSKEGLTIVLRIDDTQAVVNGKQVPLSQSAQIANGSTMVPLRFIGESTGAIVHWDQVNREITVITDRLLKQLGITKEEMQKRLDEYTAKQQQPSNPSPAEPPQVQQPTANLSDLKDLNGMYYGLREDVGGYECGGACWDMYTFLPDRRILVGPPPQGGPETIDCKRDGCSNYTISGDKLKLSNDESHTIRLSDKGELYIDDVSMSPVKPVANGLKLKGTYEYIGFSGLIGVNAASSSWTESLTFSSDGTFESTDLTLASLDATVSATHSSESKSDKGTYKIAGNTLVLTYADGTVVHSLFFDHDPGGKDSLKNIQIGTNHFYISDEEQPADPVS